MKRKIISILFILVAVIIFQRLLAYGFERCIMYGMNANQSETNYVTTR